jgi:hypothetical protein
MSPRESAGQTGVIVAVPLWLSGFVHRWADASRPGTT